MIPSGDATNFLGKIEATQKKMAETRQKDVFCVLIPHRFLKPFPAPSCKGYQVGGDEGYGHQLTDRMAEQEFYQRRFNNGSPAEQTNIFANLSAE